MLSSTPGPTLVMSHVYACWQVACVGFLGCNRALARDTSQLSAQGFWGLSSACPAKMLVYRSTDNDNTVLL